MGPTYAVTSTPFRAAIFPAMSWARSEVRYLTFSSFHSNRASYSDVRSAFLDGVDPVGP
jgi:hypothetical protein